MDRTPEAFVSARLVMVGVVAASLLAFYLAVARVFAARLALLASLGWLFELRFQARRICPEPLFSALLVLATACLARLPVARRPRLCSFLAGAFLGAAWLAKGSALLSLAAAVAWLLVRGGGRWRGRAAHAGLLLAGFALAGSPLLAWNAARHGDPVHNVNSAHVQWEDAWDFDLDRRSTATPATYVAKHDLPDAVGRLARGFARQKGVEWVYGFLALTLACALLGRLGPAPRRAWRGLAVATALAWLPAFAWYAPIVSSRRLLFPIFAVLIPPALDLLGGLLRPVGAGLARRFARLAPFAGPAASGAAGSMAVLAIVLAARHGNPYDERHVDEASLRAVAELSKPAYAGARVLAKPSRTLPPDWLLEGRVTFVSLPAAVPDEEVAAWAREHADYVLSNEGLRAHRPRFDPEALYAPVWRDGELVLLRTR